MKKQTLKENLSTEIGALKTEINALKKSIATQTDAEVRDLMQQKIAQREQTLQELVEELDELKNQQRNNVRNDLIDLIQEQRNHHLAYIATDAKYIVIKNYSTTEERVNLTSQYLTHVQLPGVLNNLIGKPGHFSLLDAEDLRTAFETAGASYMIKTASFDEPKWDKKYVFNILEIQRKYWAPTDHGSEYNELFDSLIYSLAGGRQENIDYLERWVAYKYLNPDKVKITPGLNITGKPGGNGKGLFTQLLTSIFTPMGVTVIKGKNLTGGFNSIMEGKVITVLDDERRDRFPQDELKQNSGNGSIVIEPKGVDAYSVDSTATTIVLDNTGLVKLVGGGSGGEDRRWSIVSTELTLLEVLQERFSLDTDQAKELAEQMGKLFENRVECGRWVSGLIERHGVRNMQVIQPLHGADYHARLAEQKDNYAEIFERVLPVLADQGVIPFKFIQQIVEAEMGERVRQQKTLSNKFDEFLSRKGFKNVEKIDTYIKITFPGSGTVDKIKGRVRRIRPAADTFDYSLISSRVYDKKIGLTKDCLQIHDYTAMDTDDTENDDVFAEMQNKVAKVARSLNSEKPAVAAAVDKDLVSDLDLGYVAKNTVKVAKKPDVGPLMERFFKERKSD